MLDPRLRVFTLVVATLTILLASCTTEPAESPDVASLAEDDANPTRSVPDVAATDLGDDAFEGSIAVEDQISDGASVTIASAAIEAEALEAARGWVVIHADESGAPGAMLGHVQIPLEGPAEDLVVEFDEPVEGGVVPLWAMLHIDADPEGTYEFPGPDVPLTLDGDPVMRAFELTVDSTA
jgi:hypothetical protein